MPEHKFELDYFFYGIPDTGQSTAKPTVLARTSGITPENVSECLLTSRLEPPPPDQTSEAMPSAVGLFRGDKIDYILTFARINPANLPQILYILLPAEVLRWLGGNLAPFREYSRREMPLFKEPRTELPRLPLLNPHMASVEEQSEQMLDLLLYCQDKIDTVEGLLTAHIVGTHIAIINAPPSLETRLRFLEGLNALLPLPARVGLTFATNVIKPKTTVAQIKFLAQATPIPDHVIYDWQTGKLTPEAFEKHDYARYVTSILRLDPAKVVEQTESLARTAVWRAIRKDNLSNALYWVARRAKIDSTVVAGMPTDRALVGAVLRQDPTLPDDLRVAYCRHLVRLTLPLQDWEFVDIVPGMAASQREVAENIFDYLNEVAKTDQAPLVFEMVHHWLLNVPQARALPWTRILHSAALAHLQHLIAAGDLKVVAKFLERLADPNPALKLAEIGQMIYERLRESAGKSDELAFALFLLAIEHLAAIPFRDLFDYEPMVKRLPKPIQAAMSAFKTPEAPEGVLMAATGSVPVRYRTILLARLVEVALQWRRNELIDESVLQGIIPLVDSPQAERYTLVIQYLLEDLGKSARIREMGIQGLDLIPPLYFASGKIDEGVALLRYYQDSIFKGQAAAEFGNALSDLFCRSPLSEEKMIAVLSALEKSGLRQEPLVRALTAGLISQNWNARTMEAAAAHLSMLIFNSPPLVNVVGVENVVRLLEFHAERKDETHALQVMGALVEAAVEAGKAGPPMLIDAWKHVTWSREMREAVLESLRRYMRRLPPDKTKLFPTYFGKHLGDEVREALEATRSLRTVIAEGDLVRFADDVALATGLLMDMAVTYHESKEKPSVLRLRQDLDSMGGGLDEDERIGTALNSSELADLIYALGTYQSPAARDVKRKTDINSRTQTQELLLTPPQTPVDFLIWLGNYFDFETEHRVELDLGRKSPAHIFGTRSSQVFYRETNTIIEFLKRLQEAFPVEQPPRFSQPVLRAEVRSLWEGLNLYTQRKIHLVLIEQTQRLGMVIRTIASHVSAKSLTDSKHLETGRFQPKNEIEALKWVSGYFGRKHGK